MEVACPGGSNRTVPTLDLGVGLSFELDTAELQPQASFTESLVHWRSRGTLERQEVPHFREPTSCFWDCASLADPRRSLTKCWLFAAPLALAGAPQVPGPG